VLLNNVTPINESHPVDLTISGEKIMSIDSGNKWNNVDPVQIRFTSATVFPGLINSHDHLDFNCFSVLGQRKFISYTEWGKYIHKIYKDNIDAVLRIPLDLRTAWGMYKNLLAGITTVVNHGAYLKFENPLINIYQKPQNLHSVKFEKNWKWKLNNPFLKNKDCVIHTGEGSDKLSSDEIDQLLKFNLLKRKLVGVHGVAMNETQAKNFKGLIWCPESNRVLLNKHAHIVALKAQTNLVFGTDSTLTGHWNLWHHLRFARSLQMVDDSELFRMITSTPAKLWNLNNGELKVGKDADIVVVKKKSGTSNWEDIFKTNPEEILLVVNKGKIRMFDKAMYDQLMGLPLNLHRFSRLSLKGSIKFVEGDLPSLIAAIKSYNSSVNFPIEVLEKITNSTQV
jgi:cytosine/adenosine deaminase-related metal-dependent hydrolase